jgi:hypothetical protein
VSGDDATEEKVCKTDSTHIQTRLTGTDRYIFEKIDETAYRVSEGTLTTGEVTIPAYYRPDADSEYLPVTEIGSAVTGSVTGPVFGAFWYTSLSSITIPETVMSIGWCAFSNCTSLSNITIPASITSIDEGAFSKCTSLTSISIPDGVTTIGWAAFQGCTNLTGITVAASNPNYSSEGGILYDKTKTTLIQTPPAGISGNVIVPKTVTSIGDYAFYNCTSLTSITIPAGVTTISSNAFGDCKNLTSITIPSSVTSIGWAAFYGCTGLATITIPASVKSVGQDAFEKWIDSQTINVLGHASQAAADAAWGSDWRNGCNATINYLGS